MGKGEGEIETNSGSGMVSVIVPVYNSASTLNKCVKSVLRQSYSYLKLIIVIDGAGGEQEKCKEIGEAYKKRDDRVEVIVQDHSGINHTRFSGLKHADGEFVLFVDADDWIEPDMISSMIGAMRLDAFDYVMVPFWRRLGPFRVKYPLPAEGPVYSPELFEKYFISFFGKNLLPVNAFGKLYRRSVIENSGLSPNDFTMGEDLVFNMRLFPYLKSIYLLDKPLYNYRYGGMTSKYNPLLLKDLKSQYLIKVGMIDSFSYHVADDLVRIEMVNILRADVKQRIINKGESCRHSIIDGIEREIADEFWTDVLKINKSDYTSDPFYKALSAKSSSSLYELCEREVIASRPRRLCEKVLFALFG